MTWPRGAAGQGRHGGAADMQARAVSMARRTVSGAGAPGEAHAWRGGSDQATSAVSPAA